MAESMPLAAIVAPFQSLVRDAARHRERITIIDQDESSAVVLSAEELEDLEDALAVAQSRLREAEGEMTWVPHEEVRRHLAWTGDVQGHLGTRRREPRDPLPHRRPRRTP